jgi:PAS domain S-box-containing protein
MNLNNNSKKDLEIKLNLLKAMNKHQILLVDDSNEALLSQDVNGILNFYNAGAQKIFGYSPKEARGMQSANLVPKELKPERLEKFKEVLEKGKSFEIQEERLAKGNKKIKINALVFPYETSKGRSIAARVCLLDQKGKPIEQLKKE